MSDETTGFVGSIPEHYDRALGPIFFTDYAEHTARLVAGYAPSRVLETGAGTGIVTRRLRDLLPATTMLIATDLNPPMLDVAQKKFRSGQPIEFRQADAMALPFADGSFDAVVCQFSAQFFPDKEKSYREAYRVLVRGGRYVFSVWDGGYNRHARIADEVAANFSGPIRHTSIRSGRATTKSTRSRTRYATPASSIFGLPCWPGKSKLRTSAPLRVPWSTVTR